MSKLIALFPGQGSQSIGMAQAIAESFAPANDLLNQANDILGFNLASMMFDGPESDLKLTQNTQPALFVSSMMAFAFLRAEGIDFDFVAGHSLGEYSAICAAGGFKFEDGLKLVRLRGELMASAGEKAPGAMSAIMGLEDDSLESFLEQARDAGAVVAANFNCPGQIVISGDKLAVIKAGEIIAAQGKKVIPLPVSGAFHSPLMEFAVEGLREGINTTAFSDLDTPLIANVTAQSVSSAAVIQELLVRQLTSSVMWTKSMNTAIELGVDKGIEVGNGRVLMGLMRKISRAIKVVPVADESSLDKVKELTSSF